MKNIRITPLLVLLSFGLVVSISMAIYNLVQDKTSQQGMTGILALIVAFFLALILGAERLLVRSNLLSFTAICTLEAIFIIGLIFLYFLALLTS